MSAVFSGLPRWTVWTTLSLAALACGGWWLHSTREGRRRAEALLVLPTVDVEKHDPEMAKRIGGARAAVVAQPFSGQAWGHMGNVLLAQELALEAAVCYERAELLDPDQVRWPYLRGLCLIRIRRDEALECFRRAAKLNHGFEFVDLTLSELLLFEGQLEEAESYLMHAAQLAPGHPRVLLGLARLALQRSELDDALRYATNATRATQPRRDLHLLLCQIHQQRGDVEAVDQQIALLQRLPELPADNSWDDPFLAEITRFKIGTKWTLMVAQELITAGQAPDALGLLLSRGAESSDHFNTVLMLGRAYSLSGRFSAAKRSLERAKSIDPKHPTVYFELGNLAANMSQWDEAVNHYQQALECDPNFGVAYLNIGICQRALGNPEAAIDSLRQACRQLPQNAAAHYELAQLLFETNALEDSQKYIQRAAELNPNDPRIIQLLEQLGNSP